MTERSHERSFTPIRPNPYIVGNPVRGRSMFFGREAEFELVRRRFQHSEHGGLLVFCGERRSGKTSILFQIMDERLGADFIPVLIDMQSMAVGNEIEFLTRLSEEVLTALGAGADGIERPRFTEGSNHSATFQDFVRKVLRAHPRRKLILLFDEYELFENKIDSGLLAQDVLHVLASLMENQPVFLVFTGSQHLEQRRRDYWKILGRSQFKMISFLEREDALNLVRKPVEGRVHYGEGVVEAIYRLTAGQPFYTQAICQSVVDHLNERQTNHATGEVVTAVVEGIVNNPLPQMIFLWDGLERDEKLVLALLAEGLADGSVHEGVGALTRLLKRREYPLDLDKARIATVLEKLFKSEMLLRDDRTTPPGYAFRMDLWRLWIRRQHSVWQVMRELGLEIRRTRRAPWMAVGAAAAVLVVIALVLAGSRRDGRGPGSDPVRASGPTSPFTLEAEPEGTMIYLDDRLIGMGGFREAIAADRDHLFRLTAAGYAESTLSVRVAAGDSGNLRVALRPLLGGLAIETVPSGAEIEVDGRPVGRSPVTVPGLAVARPHRVEARLGGYATAQQDFTVEANRSVPAALVLEVGKVDLTVVTEPSGSEIRVDGTVRGSSPLPLAAVPIGEHRFTASRAGHEDVDTTVAVTSNTRQIRLVLRPEPPSILVVKGDLPAQIYIDGELVKLNLQNSGPRTLASGVHEVRVTLGSGETVEKSVTLGSGEHVTYDYTTGKITRRSAGGP